MVTPSSAFTRLYLVPKQGVQSIIDVPSDVLILSGGRFTYPAVAATITLTEQPVTSNFTPHFSGAVADSLATSGQEEVRVCYREPSDIQQYTDTDVVEAVDPSGGSCICGVTCVGTELTYVKVYNVPSVV